MARIRQLEAENARLRESIAHARAPRTSATDRTLRAILDHIPSMVGYWGRDLRNRFGNHAYREWFGVDPSAMPGKHIRDIIGEERYRLNLPYIEAVLRGEPQQFERAIPSPNGKTVRYSLANYIPDIADGEVVGFYAVVTDVTAIKQAEDALRASEARYRGVIEDQTEIISRFDADGKFLFVNEVYCRLFGKAEEELIGHNWMPACHPDDLPEVAAQLGTLAPDRPVVVIENRVYDGEGRLRWMQFVNRAFFDARGRLREIQSVGRDITDRKMLEASLERSRQQLELAIEASGLGAWDYDLRTGHVARDANFLAMLGYTTGELRANCDSFTKLVHPDDLERVEAAALAHFRGDTKTYENEHRLRHKDGHFVWVFSSGKVVERDADGAPLRMIGTDRNISQTKRLADEGVSLMHRFENLLRAVAAVQPYGASPSEIERAAVDSLSRRQRQVIVMVAKGMSSADIAKALHISTGTAIGHRRDLMRKLDLHSASDVTRFAIRNRLIEE